MAIRSDKQRKAMFAKMNSGKDSIPSSSSVTVPPPVRQSFFARIRSKQEEHKKAKEQKLLQDIEKERQALKVLKEKRATRLELQRLKVSRQREEQKRANELRDLKREEKKLKQEAFRSSRTGKALLATGRGLTTAERFLVKKTRSKKKQSKKSKRGTGLIDLV